MTQLNLFEAKTKVLPAFVLDAIAWASHSDGVVVIVVNPNKQGAATWLRANLAVRQVAFQPKTNQTAVTALAPSWLADLRLTKWAGGSGSNHPINLLKW